MTGEQGGERTASPSRVAAREPGSRRDGHGRGDHLSFPFEIKIADRVSMAGWVDKDEVVIPDLLGRDPQASQLDVRELRNVDELAAHPAVIYERGERDAGEEELAPAVGISGV